MEASINRIIPSSKIMDRAIIISATTTLTTSAITIPFSNKMGTITIISVITLAMGCKIQTKISLIKHHQC